VILKAKGIVVILTPLILFDLNLLERFYCSVGNSTYKTRDYSKMGLIIFICKVSGNDDNRESAKEFSGNRRAEQ